MHIEGVAPPNESLQSIDRREVGGSRSVANAGLRLNSVVRLKNVCPYVISEVPMPIYMLCYGSAYKHLKVVESLCRAGYAAISLVFWCISS